MNPNIAFRDQHVRVFRAVSGYYDLATGLEFKERQLLRAEYPLPCEQPRPTHERTLVITTALEIAENTLTSTDKPYQFWGKG